MSMVLAFATFIFGIVVLPLIFMRLIYPGLLRKKPSFAAITAAFFALLGFFISFFVFRAALSIAMLSFSSLMMLPFVIKMLESRNTAGANADTEAASAGAYTRTGMEIQGVGWRRRWLYAQSLREIFSRHETLTLFYAFLFFGMALEYTMLFAVLPPDIGNKAFESQLQLFQPRSPGGLFVLPQLFWDILSNNLQLVFIAFALSVFYGSGSIFILSYNASIAGVLYGASLRMLIYGTPPFAGNIILFLPHTIIEILGYLLAAVAGGILIRGLYRENVRDSMLIFAIAIALIFAGAWVEITVPFL